MKVKLVFALIVSVLTVSYTHLDVYKRQSVDKAIRSFLTEYSDERLAIHGKKARMRSHEECSGNFVNSIMSETLRLNKKIWPIDKSTLAIGFSSSSRFKLFFRGLSESTPSGLSSKVVIKVC